MTINPFILHGEEITPVRKLLYLKAFAGGGALSEYEITGNPVAFATNVAKPLSAFTIPFLPVQSGTGDPSPENVRPISGWSGVNAWRTGKNLFDENNPAPLQDCFNYQGNAQSRRGVKIETAPGTYTVFSNATPSGGYIYFNVLNKDGTLAYYNTIISNKDKNTRTFTVSEGQYIVIFDQQANAADSQVKWKGAEVQLEPGSTASPYTEYAGDSYPVVFPALGKNLLNPANNNSLYYGESNDYTLTDGVIVSIEGGSVLMGFKVKCEPNTKYTFTFTTTNDINMRVYGYPEEPETYTIGNQLVNWNDHDEATFMTGESDEWLICGIYIARDKPVTTVSNFQLEIGETATAYEPFDNTVYGGTLDAVNGVLTVVWAKVDFADLVWVNTNQSANGVFRANLPSCRLLSDKFNIVSDEYKSADSSLSIADMTDNTIKGYNGEQYRDYVYIRDSRFTDRSAFTEGVDCEIVYQLATPYEIQLDPITVQTLIGDNTIWTDTNGENTIKYKKKG